MSLSRFLQLLSLYIVLSADICDGADPTCKFEWFGTPCRYKCHCDSGTCNKTTGECTQPTTCEKGWFGPSCQYVDLVITNATSPPAWIYDYQYSLCNRGQETVNISLTDEFYFTWLRLRTNVTVSSQGFKLQLMPLKGSSVECSNPSVYVVNDTIMDIHCQKGVFFQQLTITGDGVKYLCSVQISGGRNIALGQSTSQTSAFDGYGYIFDSWFAVDGDLNPDWEQGSCTQTKQYDTTPSWTLTFARPHHINRYLLYNRDNVRERLRGFILEADQENKSVAFTYRDGSNTNKGIYRIQSTTPRIPVSRVTIVATYIRDLYLTLCEVEMFGDTVCPVGQYGKECENKCNCAKNGENCFVSTGGCPSGCAAGYVGEGCGTPCNKKYFGPSCSQKCSADCKNQDCQPSDGTCLSCEPGKKLPKCNEDCDPRSWGDNCSMSCPAECKDELCDPVTGICKSCPAGKFGQSCENACNATSYGEGCALSCSLNCFDQHCNATNGNCLSCVTGKSGLFCSEAVPVKEEDESPPVAAIVGPVVAVVVLIALIVGGVFIWRKYNHMNNNHGQTSSRRHTNIEQTECMRGGKSGTSKSQPLNSVTGQATPSDNPYEIPVIQKSQQLKSEEGLAYANGITDNPYESIDDTTPSPYDEITDI